MELTRQDKRLLLLHLVNYKPTEMIKDIRVIIRPPRQTLVREAALVTPENIAGQNLRFESGHDGISVRVPSMRVYGLVRMTLEEA
jgi:hypothetical protein